MFEIISNPFEKAGESLSGLAIEKAIDVVIPSTSKGFSWWGFLFFFLLIVFGAGLYLVYFYFPKKKKEEGKKRLEAAEKVKGQILLNPNMV
ncbi:hypothetical protein SAMN04515674_10725 [Pseudarcicella hirudinis]|uniref:Uncharacterized protein n=1 Tax=Pseudarcicella hirudinis TaxID=1079859 RepID=A0A1I5U710_9BACT|nr:hypothetical protein [Pseudarcicella hirudinis]SFP91052.1 hypothetical protein SAMN04515674_10725 [Pseudarcicella hirudinis]